jgi:Flp pilus assembly protein TadG
MLVESYGAGWCMRTTAFGLVGRLCRNSRGAKLIKFTIAFLPLLSVAAVAMDFSRVLVVKQNFTNAVDATALAVGRQLGRDDADITALAQGFVNAHYTAADVGALRNLAVASTATQVDITATARVGTVFLSVLSTPFVDITVSSKVFCQQRKFELVMVLDNSGSMAGMKLANFKSAAHGLVDIVFGSATESPYVKIAIVPVTAAVNVGTDKIRSSWLDQTGLLPIHREDIDLPAGHTLLSLIGSLKNSGWGGCVTARVGPQGSDAPPDPLVEKTLFVPDFAPDEPGSGNGPAFAESVYTDDYINDMLIPGTLVARQRNGLKYLGAAVLTPGYGPNYNCVAAPTLPLTNVKATINSAIDAMAAGGNTVIPEGVAWGRRVLSPGPPFTEGAPYDDQTTIKIILLTAAANPYRAQAAKTIPISQPTALPRPDGSERPTARKHGSYWMRRQRLSATTSRLTTTASRPISKHTSIPSPSRSQTVQGGPCCKIALRRQTSASAISVTSKARLSRRCGVSLPISRLDSISYGLRIEFGLE